MSRPAPRHPSRAPNLNRFWADLLVEELVRQGVGLFCLAPGSRSTPLATAVAANPRAEHLMHFDERGSAFAALGWARATGRPACWVTTSGTAVANGLPAVVEAATDGVPLIALTADRPPELRQTGANQTVDQPGIFGGFPRWRADLPPPDAAVDPAFILTTAAQAVHRSLHPPGPVHLNAMFREPLAPDDDGAPLPAVPPRWRDSREPFTRYEAAAGAPHLAPLAEALLGVDRGLIVAGRLPGIAEGDAALRLAEHLGWPLIGDITSQTRLGSTAAIGHADLLLASDAFSAEHRPDAVIYLGAPAVSGRLARFLAASGARPYAVVRPDPDRWDPDHRASHRIQSTAAAFCDGLIELLPERAPTGWRAAWAAANEAAARVATTQLDRQRGPTEPGVARMVARHVHAEHAIVVASSMPIRDLDAFAGSDGPRVPVFASRGASGIDGTVATAAGVARGTGRPVTLLIGDLALLHDLNSLALLRTPGTPPVTVVVLNNDGGGIFHFLPIAEHEEVFEPLFGTPHGMDFEHAARQFGLAYQRPAASGDFLEAYRTAGASASPTLIEVTTDRRENHALHVALREAVARALTEVAA